MTERIEAARQILAGLFDASAIVDRDNRLLDVNDAFAHLTGLGRRRLQKRIDDGATLFDIIKGEGDAIPAALYAAQQSGRAERVAEVALVAGEQAITAWLAFIPLGDGHRTVQMVLRDVTAEARMQSHFRELLAESMARADELEKKVVERTAELDRALQEVTRLARADPLTGLLNRRAFTDAAEHTLALAARANRVVGLLMCDLDHFKKVNDTFGHAAGDAVLVASAQALVRTVRSTDRVARFGGEEFLVLLPETSHDSVLDVGQRCCASVRKLPVAELVPGKETPQTLSIGVALFPDHGETLTTLLQRADTALYEAKNAGRDQVRLAT